MIHLTAVIAGRRTLVIGLLPVDPPVGIDCLDDDIDELLFICGKSHAWIVARVERLAALSPQPGAS